MAETGMVTVGELEAELAGIGALVEAAAAAEDAGEFTRLLMRERALPGMIADAKAGPIRRELERLEQEMAELVEEEERLRRAPLPEVPRERRGHQTPTMLRSQQLDGVRTRQDICARESGQLERRLTEIEAEV